MTTDAIGAIDERTLAAAGDELLELLAVVQVLEERFRERGRPYLAMRARELEGRCHDVLDKLFGAAIGEGGEYGGR